MRLKFFSAFSIFFILYTLFLGSADAHVLKSDGDIGAVLHISPEDDPIAGEVGGFFFDFKDKTNRFKPEECVCTFSILENGREIYSTPLFLNNTDPSLDNPSVFYTFPRRGVYSVKVTGTPKEEKTFSDFSLAFDIRVEREKIVEDGDKGFFYKTPVYLYYGLGLGIAFVMFLILKFLLVRR